jgi:hypothetical protein
LAISPFQSNARTLLVAPFVRAIVDCSTSDLDAVKANNGHDVDITTKRE